MPARKTVTGKKNAKRARSPSQEPEISDSEVSTAEEDEQPPKRQKKTTVQDTSDEEVEGEGSSPAVQPKKKPGRPRKAPAKAKAKSKTTKSQPDAEPAPKLTGKFDLYSMELPFLNKVYASATKETTQPEDLYNTILTYQAKDDRTAKVTIPDNYASVSSARGSLESNALCDPMIEAPFEIAITHIKDAAKIGFASTFGRPAAGSNVWDGPGITAKIVLKHDQCGITSSKGHFKMQPMWKKVDEEGELRELFEGSFKFVVKFNSMYSTSGMGKGMSLEVPFWAVRAAE